MLFVCISFGFDQQLTQPRSRQTSWRLGPAPHIPAAGRSSVPCTPAAGQSPAVTGQENPGQGSRHPPDPEGHWACRCRRTSSPLSWPPARDSSVPLEPTCCTQAALSLRLLVTAAPHHRQAHPFPRPPDVLRSQPAPCRVRGSKRGALVLLFALRFPFHVCSLWPSPQQPLRGSPMMT